MVPWILLALAIIAEVFATVMLKMSDGLTRLLPSIGMVLGYGLAFYLESQVIRLGVPMAVTYAVWAGGGIALVVLANRVVFAEPITPMTIGGMGLILAGVLVVQLSGVSSHPA
ncbi:multidrug efflux SMR transporter [Kutzneria viridogrisea]|uniref:Small multidrug resistance pump n=2 Tax=Kutzneria TaxID=43356 RepID=A0ABR6BTQ3_9PSEU|nr:multidrug efflux SMR transporter [Kutzneria albida]AHH94635.1 putative membrane protein [Kutzneria albida DSM 43870]MBA8930303.1 small multidrug resistance pump [Kutzneria viridogrisea]